MNEFIAKSEESKKILNIIQVSSNLPVNIFIKGESGVGKRLLAKKVLPHTIVMDARFLENEIIANDLNTEQYKELIITDIHKVLNKKEFLQYLKNTKIVATSQTYLHETEEYFPIKIEISNLEQRKEDLEEISNRYINDANQIYDTEVSLNNLKLDISQNGKSLKKSIYKNVFLYSLNEADFTLALENIISKKLDEKKTYKDFLKMIEIPLLNTAKSKFKSQLQMANKLSLNRITLRKKIENYFGNDNE